MTPLIILQIANGLLALSLGSRRDSVDALLTELPQLTSAHDEMIVIQNSSYEGINGFHTLVFAEERLYGVGFVSDSLPRQKGIKSYRKFLKALKARGAHPEAGRKPKGRFASYLLAKDTSYEVRFSEITSRLEFLKCLPQYWWRRKVEWDY